MSLPALKEPVISRGRETCIILNISNFSLRSIKSANASLSCIKDVNSWFEINILYHFEKNISILSLLSFKI